MDHRAESDTPVNPARLTHDYRGRFAPSPTGPLHFGSLVSAVGSYCQARQQGGHWLVRMEDLDKGREQPGAADNILRTLEAFGLYWDESVVWQSQRLPLYEHAIEELRRMRTVYPCACSRSDIRQQTDRIKTPVYPGTCREGLQSGQQARSVRIKTVPGLIGFIDALQGPQTQDIQNDVGDFVLQRADGFYAYQLAVVIDDAAQGISDVVRGADLLDNTPRQIFLQQLLGLHTPAYLHLPVATNSAGEKLSKQTFAKPVDVTSPVPELVKALRFLGQEIPSELPHESLSAVWQWTNEHWKTLNIPKKLKIQITPAL